MKNKTTIKLLLFSLIIVLFSGNELFSQSSTIKLIGFNFDQNQSVNIVKWNANSTVFNSIYPTNVLGILSGSSTFDSKTGNYFARVQDNTTGVVENKLLKFNSNANSIFLNPIDNFYNGGSEVDMQTGFVYTYDGNEENNIFLSQYNPETGISTNVGNFNFSPNTGFLVDSTCYDSNSKKYYFIILDGTIVKLITASVNSQPFSYTETVIMDSENTGNIGLEFSNETNTIYAMYSSINVATNDYSIHVGSLNPITGVLSSIVNLDTVYGYQLSNSTFDQASQSFVFVGIDYSNNYGLYVINTATATTEVLPLPEENLIEIECDNSNYAQSKYGTLSVNESENFKIRLYPNPATTSFKVDFNGNPSDYTITNLLGKIVASGTVSSLESIDISSLSKGVYIFNLIQNEKIYTEKLSVN